MSDISSKGKKQKPDSKIFNMEYSKYLQMDDEKRKHYDEIFEQLQIENVNAKIYQNERNQMQQQIQNSQNKQAYDQFNEISQNQSIKIDSQNPVIQQIQVQQQVLSPGNVQIKISNTIVNNEILEEEKKDNEHPIKEQQLEKIITKVNSDQQQQQQRIDFDRQNDDDDYDDTMIETLDNHIIKKVRKQRKSVYDIQMKDLEQVRLKRKQIKKLGSKLDYQQSFKESKHINLKVMLQGLVMMAMMHPNQKQEQEQKKIKKDFEKNNQLEFFNIIRLYFLPRQIIRVCWEILFFIAVILICFVGQNVNIQSGNDWVIPYVENSHLSIRIMNCQIKILSSKESDEYDKELDEYNKYDQDKIYVSYYMHTQKEKNQDHPNEYCLIKKNDDINDVDYYYGDCSSGTENLITQPGGWHLQMISFRENLKYCHATIRLPDYANLGSLSTVCEDSSLIDEGSSLSWQQSQSNALKEQYTSCFLISRHFNLNVHGKATFLRESFFGRFGVNMVSLAAYSVQVYILSSGSFQIHKLTNLQGQIENGESIPSSTIYIRKGDAVIQTPEALAVSYGTTDEDYFCFSGYEVHSFAQFNSSEQCQDYQRAAIDPVQFCGTVFFRSEDFPKVNYELNNSLPIYYQNGGNNQLAVPLVRIIVQHGNIYVNQIKQTWQKDGRLPLFQYYEQLLKGNIYTEDFESVKLEEEDFKSQMQEMHNKTKESQDDWIYLLTIGYSYQQSSQNVMWMATSNPMYAKIKPWRIGVMSFGVLDPPPTKLDGLLLPGFCPYHNTLSLDQYFHIQNLLYSIFKDEQNPEMLITFIHPENRTLPVNQEVFDNTSFNYPLSVFSNNPNAEELWYEIVSQDNVYVLKIMDAQRSMWITASIVFSIISAVVIASICMYHFLSYLQNLNDASYASSGLYKKYYSLLIKRCQDDDDGQEGDSEMMEGHEFDEDDAGRKQSAKIDVTFKHASIQRLIKSLPRPAAVLTYFPFKIIHEYFMLSHADFYKYLFRPIQPNERRAVMDDIQSLEMREKNLKAFYERFCFLIGYPEVLYESNKQNKRQLEEIYGFTLIEDKESSVILTKIIEKMKKPTPTVSMLAEMQDSFSIFLEFNYDLTESDADFEWVSDIREKYHKFCKTYKLQYQDLRVTELARAYDLGVGYSPRKKLVKLKEKTQFAESIDQDMSTQLIIIKKIVWHIRDYFRGKGNTTMEELLRGKQYVIDRSQLEAFFKLQSNPVFFKTEFENLEYHSVDEPEAKEKVLMYKKVLKQSIYYKHWFLSDMMSAAFNVLITIVVILPLFFGVVILHADYAPYTLHAPHLTMTWDDLRVHFLTMFEFFEFIDNSTTALAIIAFLMFIFFFVDSLYYNIVHASFPEDSCFRMGQERDSDQKFMDVLSYIWSLFLWMLMFVYLAADVCYVVLITIWLSLGAIVNPSNLLFYSTGAVTAAVFFVLNFYKILNLVELGHEKIRRTVDEVFRMQMSEIANFLIKNQSGLSGPFLPDQATRRAAYKLDITEHLAEFNKMMENHLHSPKEIIREGGTTKPQALLKIITGEAGRIQQAMNLHAVQKIANIGLSVNVINSFVQVLQLQFLHLVESNTIASQQMNLARKAIDNVKGNNSMLRSKEEELINAVASLVFRITNNIITNKITSYFMNIIMGRRFFVANTGNFIEAIIEMAVQRLDFDSLKGNTLDNTNNLQKQIIQYIQPVLFNIKSLVENIQSGNPKKIIITVKRLIQEDGPCTHANNLRNREWNFYQAFLDYLILLFSANSTGLYRQVVTSKFMHIMNVSEKLSLLLVLFYASPNQLSIKFENTEISQKNELTPFLKFFYNDMFQGKEIFDQRQQWIQQQNKQKKQTSIISKKKQQMTGQIESPMITPQDAATMTGTQKSKLAHSTTQGDFQQFMLESGQDLVQERVDEQAKIFSQHFQFLIELHRGLLDPQSLQIFGDDLKNRELMGNIAPLVLLSWSNQLSEIEQLSKMTGISQQIIKEIIAISDEGYLLNMMSEEDRATILKKSPKLLQIIARDLQIGPSELIGLITFFHSADKTCTLYHQAFLAYLFKQSNIYFMQDKDYYLLMLRLAMSKNPFEQLYIVENYPHLLEPLAIKLRLYDLEREEQQYLDEQQKHLQSPQAVNNKRLSTEKGVVQGGTSSGQGTIHKQDALAQQSRRPSSRKIERNKSSGHNYQFKQLKSAHDLNQIQISDVIQENQNQKPSKSTTNSSREQLKSILDKRKKEREVENALQAERDVYHDISVASLLHDEYFLKQIVSWPFFHVFKNIYFAVEAFQPKEIEQQQDLLKRPYRNISEDSIMKLLQHQKRCRNISQKQQQEGVSGGGVVNSPNQQLNTEEAVGIDYCEREFNNRFGNYCNLQLGKYPYGNEPKSEPFARKIYWLAQFLNLQHRLKKSKMTNSQDIEKMDILIKFSEEFNLNPEGMIHLFNLLLLNDNSSISLYYFLNKGKDILHHELSDLNDQLLKSSLKYLITFLRVKEEYFQLGDFSHYKESNVQSKHQSEDNQDNQHNDSDDPNNFLPNFVRRNNLVQKFLFEGSQQRINDALDNFQIQEQLNHPQGQNGGALENQNLIINDILNFCQQQKIISMKIRDFLISLITAVLNFQYINYDFLRHLQKLFICPFVKELSTQVTGDPKNGRYTGVQQGQAQQSQQKSEEEEQLQQNQAPQQLLPQSQGVGSKDNYITVQVQIEDQEYCYSRIQYRQDFSWISVLQDISIGKFSSIIQQQILRLQENVIKKVEKQCELLDNAQKGDPIQYKKLKSIYVEENKDLQQHAINHNHDQDQQKHIKIKSQQKIKMPYQEEMFMQTALSILLGLQEKGESQFQKFQSLNGKFSILIEDFFSQMKLALTIDQLAYAQLGRRIMMHLYGISTLRVKQLATVLSLFSDNPHYDELSTLLKVNSFEIELPVFIARLVASPNNRARRAAITSFQTTSASHKLCKRFEIKDELFPVVCKVIFRCNQDDHDWMQFIRTFGLTDTLSIQLLKGVVGFSSLDEDPGISVGGGDKVQGDDSVDDLKLSFKSSTANMKKRDINMTQFNSQSLIDEQINGENGSIEGRFNNNKNTQKDRDSNEDYMQSKYKIMFTKRQVFYYLGTLKESNQQAVAGELGYIVYSGRFMDLVHLHRLGMMELAEAEFFGDGGDSDQHVELVAAILGFSRFLCDFHTLETMTYHEIRIMLQEFSSDRVVMRNNAVTALYLLYKHLKISPLLLLVIFDNKDAQLMLQNVLDEVKVDEKLPDQLFCYEDDQEEGYNDEDSQRDLMKKKNGGKRLKFFDMDYQKKKKQKEKQLQMLEQNKHEQQVKNGHITIDLNNNTYFGSGRGGAASSAQKDHESNTIQDQQSQQGVFSNEKSIPKIIQFDNNNEEQVNDLDKQDNQQLQQQQEQSQQVQQPQLELEQIDEISSAKKQKSILKNSSPTKSNAKVNYQGSLLPLLHQTVTHNQQPNEQQIDIEQPSLNHENLQHIINPIGQQTPYQIMDDKLFEKTKWQQQVTLQQQKWYYFIEQIQLHSQRIELQCALYQEKEQAKIDGMAQQLISSAPSQQQKEPKYDYLEKVLLKLPKLEQIPLDNINACRYPRYMLQILTALRLMRDTVRRQDNLEENYTTYYLEMMQLLKIIYKEIVEHCEVHKQDNLKNLNVAQIIHLQITSLLPEHKLRSSHHRHQIEQIKLILQLEIVQEINYQQQRKQKQMTDKEQISEIQSHSTINKGHHKRVDSKDGGGGTNDSKDKQQQQIAADKDISFSSVMAHQPSVLDQHSQCVQQSRKFILDSLTELKEKYKFYTSIIGSQDAEETGKLLKIIAQSLVDTDQIQDYSFIIALFSYLCLISIRMQSCERTDISIINKLLETLFERRRMSPHHLKNFFGTLIKKKVDFGPFQDFVKACDFLNVGLMLAITRILSIKYNTGPHYAFEYDEQAAHLEKNSPQDISQQNSSAGQSPLIGFKKLSTVTIKKNHLIQQQKESEKQKKNQTQHAHKNNSNIDSNRSSSGKFERNRPPSELYKLGEVSDSIHNIMTKLQVDHEQSEVLQKLIHAYLGNIYTGWVPLMEELCICSLYLPMDVMREQSEQLYKRIEKVKCFVVSSAQQLLLFLNQNIPRSNRLRIADMHQRSLLDLIPQFYIPRLIKMIFTSQHTFNNETEIIRPPSKEDDKQHCLDISDLLYELIYALGVKHDALCLNEIQNYLQQTLQIKQQHQRTYKLMLLIMQMSPRSSTFMLGKENNTGKNPIKYFNEIIIKQVIDEYISKIPAKALEEPNIIQKSQQGGTTQKQQLFMGIIKPSLIQLDQQKQEQTIKPDLNLDQLQMMFKLACNVCFDILRQDYGQVFANILTLYKNIFNTYNVIIELQHSVLIWLYSKIKYMIQDLNDSDLDKLCEDLVKPLIKNTINLQFHQLTININHVQNHFNNNIIISQKINYNHKNFTTFLNPFFNMIWKCFKNLNLHVEDLHNLMFLYMKQHFEAHYDMIESELKSQEKDKKMRKQNTKHQTKANLKTTSLMFETNKTDLLELKPHDIFNKLNDYCILLKYYMQKKNETDQKIKYQRSTNHKSEMQKQSSKPNNKEEEEKEKLINAANFKKEYSKIKTQTESAIIIFIYTKSFKYKKNLRIPDIKNLLGQARVQFFEGNFKEIYFSQNAQFFFQWLEEGDITIDILDKPDLKRYFQKYIEDTVKIFNPMSKDEEKDQKNPLQREDQLETLKQNLVKDNVKSIQILVNNLIDDFSKNMQYFAHELESFIEYYNDNGFEIIQFNKLIEIFSEIALMKPNKTIFKDIIQAVLAVVNKEYHNIPDEFWGMVGVTPGDSSRFAQFLMEFKTQILLPNQYIDYQISRVSDALTGANIIELREILDKSIKGQGFSKQDLFSLLDSDDHSGVISIHEFKRFLIRVGLHLSEHRIMEIVSYVKTEDLVNDYKHWRDLDFGPEEFKHAIIFLENMNVRKSMENMGIVQTKLLWVLFWQCVLLFFYYAFITVTVRGFSLPGTFGAIINSIFPILGGFALSTTKRKKIRLDNQDNLKQVVQKTLNCYQNNNL